MIFKFIKSKTLIINSIFKIIWIMINKLNKIKKFLIMSRLNNFN